MQNLEFRIQNGKRSEEIIKCRIKNAEEGVRSYERIRSLWR